MTLIPSAATKREHEVPTISGITIRPITDPAELEACVTIQHDTWGQGFSDIVPTSMLQITAKMGGVVSGAFNEAGKLLGLVYGITGVRNGRLSHWSHMLAVRPEVRNSGVGQALKFHQRSLLRDLEVEVMYWTFDPLVARNAHLNLNRLGARVDEYVVDMYGNSDSDLHRLGTDRFIVRWELDRENEPEPEPAELPDVVVSRGGERTPYPGAPAVGLPVPRDIEAIEAADFDDAMAWRTFTRDVFVHYTGRGYGVTGFVPGDHLGHYVLTRSTD